MSVYSIIHKIRKNIKLLSFTFVLLDLSLTVNATNLLLISGRVSAISSAKQGNSGFIYNLEKN